MRVNFLLLALIMLLVSAGAALRGNYGQVAAGIALAVGMVIVHFIRARRFKRFDERLQQGETFD